MFTCQFKSENEEGKGGVKGRRKWRGRGKTDCSTIAMIRTSFNVDSRKLLKEKRQLRKSEH
jgi:hypothetical protein